MAGVRIFDHLDNAPREQDHLFSRVARQMRRAPWWLVPSQWTEPPPVCGEMEWR